MMPNPRATLGKSIRHYKVKDSRKVHMSGVKNFGWQGSFYDIVFQGSDEFLRWLITEGQQQLLMTKNGERTYNYPNRITLQKS